MENILYDTKTFCPICTILDRKGLILKSAIVVERQDKVYLKCLCDQQHQQPVETLYCSSSKFFKRMMAFDPVISGANSKNPIRDIESMGKYINKNNQPEISSNPTSSNFILEFNIYQNSKFLSDDEIKQQLIQFQTYYPKNRKFVLKVIARGCSDIISINEKVKFISKQLKGYPILLECTLERLNSIAKLNDSALLGTKVYPAVKYFLKRGDESLFIRDINNLLNVLRDYSDMQCVVTVALERKFANLGEILALLRKNNTLIRFIVLSLERPPKELVESLQIKNKLSLDQMFKENCKVSNGECNDGSSNVASSSSSSSSNEETLANDGGSGSSSSSSSSSSSNGSGNIHDSLCCNFNDPYELIQEIERSTNNTISSDDFYPLNIGQALEPMFNLMGYGLYSIKPSSYCSFATCLVNTDTIESRPINRLVNFSKLYYDLLPILPDIEEKIGFFSGLKIKSLLKNCYLPGVPLPNIFDYLTDKSKSEITRKVIDQTQILIIHNNMDLASLDLKRRCHCSVETKIRDGYIASCTGCI